MSDEVHAKILLTIFAVWLVLWPAIQDVLRPERLTNRVQRNPETLQRVLSHFRGYDETMKLAAKLAPWIPWFRLVVPTCFLTYMWWRL
jgi:hypothetical protein